MLLIMQPGEFEHKSYRFISLKIAGFGVHCIFTYLNQMQSSIKIQTFKMFSASMHKGSLIWSYNYLIE